MRTQRVPMRCRIELPDAPGRQVPADMDVPSFAEAVASIADHWQRNRDKGVYRTEGGSHAVGAPDDNSGAGIGGHLPSVCCGYRGAGKEPGVGLYASIGLQLDRFLSGRQYWGSLRPY